jgi:hypothetical protein
VESIAESHLMNESAHTYFRRRSRASDPPHVFTASIWRERVHYWRKGVLAGYFKDFRRAVRQTLNFSATPAANGGGNAFPTWR